MNLDYNVFADDYRKNVASAAPHIVTRFINRLKDDMEGNEDHEALWVEFGGDYTSIMDAMLRWVAGAAHARKILKEQKLIQVSEKALSFNGDSQTALYLVNDLRESYQANGMEMPKMLSDFVFKIEVALQDAGVLDELFEVVRA